MKRILITGAASGIGLATARLFHRNGWTLGLTDINHDALVELASELDQCWYRQLDVTDDIACRHACQEFAADSGGLDVLFNCAGILQMGHFEDISAEQHKRIIDINVTGLINMTLAAHPLLQDSNSAAVINMSSASALYGTPHFASYSASKFAVRALTEALDIEWGRQGIRVLDIMPPFVSTPMLTEASFRSPVVDRMGVNLDADDIARTVFQAATETAPVHNPVGGVFKLMTLSNKLLPSRATRLLMQFMSRE
ncbi:MAG: short-chain dehydrogenase [Alcanivoracaceae bacterium]|uniref:SDR family oxidoreductase n=1 Tax=Alcanivorax sp. MD8A TaxID=1177157 RepID=UPI000C5C647C|nr:SDR family oxidoreductase [Alcanivorax sp. MD8A]MAX57090.1 short-chain dehydrogenase [Alcanivoracaceae bacterium]MCG8439281.1 SDR family oxidoreductase [Pseudomonadales bacterium]MED5431536.1 SDR family oxidoreductase [Pseudomonadota bacterium]MEE2869869.1 SDR family oxidoreductase [Pseudomonadota bacterium]PNE02292.1 short chain dehydrogenase [Alcanivorax sp. MD8A]|tara:strand:+ start:917 stop:1678 length:762 start_codon:yes stop_codon:yes gene_type:complete